MPYFYVVVSMSPRFKQPASESANLKSDNLWCKSKKKGEFWWHLEATVGYAMWVSPLLLYPWEKPWLQRRQISIAGKIDNRFVRTCICFIYLLGGETLAIFKGIPLVFQFSSVIFLSKFVDHLLKYILSTCVGRLLCYMLYNPTCIDN